MTSNRTRPRIVAIAAIAAAVLALPGGAFASLADG